MIFCLFLVMFPDQSLTQESIRQAVCSDITFSFIYLAHPRSVTGISWRKTSKYMPRGAVANMLVTSCSGKHQKRFLSQRHVFRKFTQSKIMSFIKLINIIPKLEPPQTTVLPKKISLSVCERGTYIKEVTQTH